MNRSDDCQNGKLSVMKEHNTDRTYSYQYHPFECNPAPRRLTFVDNYFVFLQSVLSMWNDPLIVFYMALVEVVSFSSFLETLRTFFLWTALRRHRYSWSHYVFICDVGHIHGKRFHFVSIFFLTRIFNYLVSS